MVRIWRSDGTKKNLGFVAVEKGVVPFVLADAGLNGELQLHANFGVVSNYVSPQAGIS